MPQRYIGVISSPTVEGFPPGAVRDWLNDEGPLGVSVNELVPVARGVRRVRWDAGWRPQVQPGDDEPLPEELARRIPFEAAVAAAAREATRADYCLAWAPADSAEWAWHPRLSRRGDLRAALHRPADYYRARMTGEQLLALDAAAREGLKDVRLVPLPDPATVRPEAVYRVCMPSWIPWTLAGQLHYNLPQVEWRRTDELWERFDAKLEVPRASPP